MSWVKVSTGLAQGILRSRDLRRKFIANLLFVTLGWMAVGLWLIDGWLGASPWRFLIWWSVCGLLTVVVMLFALYDALAVVREEKSGTKEREERK